MANLSADLVDDDGESTVAKHTPSCPSFPQNIALDSELGSVGFMKNIAEHPESIRAIAVRLLSKAVESDAFKTAPECNNGCPDNPQAAVVYKVEPTVFLPESEQQAMCLTLEEQTSKQAMTFERRKFESLEKLNEWIMAFSQGRGDDGKALYEQCGGNCSPRYTFSIEQTGETFTIDSDVLCGLARDKKSDQYLVSTEVRWDCAVAGE